MKTDEHGKSVLTNLPATQPQPTYEVGYKKPPKASRFLKGQSGNPKGRPKGSKNQPKAVPGHQLHAIILEEAYRTIPTLDQGRTVDISLAQAITRSLSVKAAKGDHRSQRLFMELLQSVETSKARSYEELQEVAIGYKVDWERELDRRERLGLNLPPPLPHPDHVRIDMQTGHVRIIGPCNKREKVKWDWFQRQRQKFCEERSQTLEDIRGADAKLRAFLEQDLVHTNRVIEIIDNALDNWDRLLEREFSPDQERDILQQMKQDESAEPYNHS